ncbi:MAG: DUF563 domain-containing protein [Vicinamibacterales bacterium]
MSGGDPVERLLASAGALRREIAEARAQVSRLGESLDAARAANRQQVKTWRRDTTRRVRELAGTTPTIAAGVVEITGSPPRRAAVRTLTAGTPVAIPLAQWTGITRVADAALDVRADWNQLLASEAAASQGLLHSAPARVLDLGPAALWRDGTGMRAALLESTPAAPDIAVLAVPRFTCNVFPRKLRNFGHWLLDYLPQVVALRHLAPGAIVLLPPGLGGFHAATLALTGVGDGEGRPWEGERLTAGRLLLLDHDGRLGGGRPLSLLREMQTALGAPPQPPAPGERLYVSRRDARKSRRWITNEKAVEGVFARHGFRILRLSLCPLPEQVRLFRDARVVAGVSGAGLSDMVFAPAGAHLIVLHSDGLMRWYTEADRSRSHWTDAAAARDGELATLGDSPRFYAHMAAALSQSCHSFLGADEVPLHELEAFLTEVLPATAARP